jgi:hypothetical protein
LLFSAYAFAAGFKSYALPFVDSTKRLAPTGSCAYLFS